MKGDWLSMVYLADRQGFETLHAYGFVTKKLLKLILKQSHLHHGCGCCYRHPALIDSKLTNRWTPGSRVVTRPVACQKQQWGVYPCEAVTPSLKDIFKQADKWTPKAWQMKLERVMRPVACGEKQRMRCPTLMRQRHQHEKTICWWRNVKPDWKEVIIMCFPDI